MDFRCGYVAVVGRPNADFSVLQLAYAFQEATLFYQQAPPLATDGA